MLAGDLLIMFTNARRGNIAHRLQELSVLGGEEIANMQLCIPGEMGGSGWFYQVLKRVALRMKCQANTVVLNNNVKA
jgi:hypothetical protein